MRFCPKKQKNACNAISRHVRRIECTVFIKSVHVQTLNWKASCFPKTSISALANNVIQTPGDGSRWRAVKQRRYGYLSIWGCQTICSQWKIGQEYAKSLALMSRLKSQVDLKNGSEVLHVCFDCLEYFFGLFGSIGSLWVHDVVSPSVLYVLKMRGGFCVSISSRFLSGS
jgi:hypothetical protein